MCLLTPYALAGLVSIRLRDVKCAENDCVQCCSLM